MITCQSCQKGVATVHVTEIVERTTGKSSSKEKRTRREVREQHLCESCASGMDLPHAPAVKKAMADIWKLLQASTHKSRRKSPACPDCGMTLDEFNKKGRLGCARDYEVFKDHLGELLEQMQGSRAHVGRIPGASEEQVRHTQRVDALRAQLEDAIRTEAYESAARLRDEIKALGGSEGA